jgi:hypothetical protein
MGRKATWNKTARDARNRGFTRYFDSDWRINNSTTGIKSMDIRSEVRVLNMFEAFAEARKPLSLTELAERIGIAPSTCHSLVKSVERSGYLYAAKARGALYPTRRIYDVAQQIMQNDLISPAIRARLERLRDETGESCCLAKRRDGDVVYLEVSESLQSIRFTVAVGETRPLHANSMGKAILASSRIKRWPRPPLWKPTSNRAASAAGIPTSARPPSTLSPRQCRCASAASGTACLSSGRTTAWSRSLSRISRRCAVR